MRKNEKRGRTREGMKKEVEGEIGRKRGKNDNERKVNG